MNSHRLAVTVHEPVYSTPLFDGLAYLGQNSYSVYLWHFPVMYLIGLYLPSTGNWYLALIAVQNIAGLIVGLVMAKLIEMPVLKCPN